MATILEQLLKNILGKNSDLLKKIIGTGGCKFLGTGGHTDLNGYAFIAQEDTEVSVFSVNGSDSLSGYGLSGATLKAGAYISVPENSSITAITIDSGSVIIYNL